MVKTSGHRATRSDGIQSRETILNAAARLATIEGLEGMSIGRLADYIGMSKSGLYAHFGSKEELQLATVETASDIFRADVIQRSENITDPVARLEALGNAFLDHLERDIFPGGCFFVSAIAEFDTRPGPVLDKVRETTDRWMAMFVSLLEQTQGEGRLAAGEDIPQLAWELESFLLMGNMGWVISKDPQPLDRARAAFKARLAAALS